MIEIVVSLLPMLFADGRSKLCLHCHCEILEVGVAGSFLSVAFVYLGFGGGVEVRLASFQILDMPHMLPKDEE